jgi:trans-aconitate 2-methyltransferase
VAWDPAQYLKYAGERQRPALDLIGRIPLAAPRTIVDLGCGAGNVTRVLGERWPGARIRGVDNAASMLARAREAAQGDARFDWIEADLADFAPGEPVDLLFSNAALHWLDGHAELFPRLFDFVAPAGVLAVQMPSNFGAPSHTILADIATSPRWRAQLGRIVRTAPVAPAADYFALLAPLAREVDAWTTEYLHVLAPATEGEHPVVAWTRGTALTPFLAALDAGAQRAFLADYRARIAQAYPLLADGCVLFPFRRLFVVAVRAETRR